MAKRFGRTTAGDLIREARRRSGLTQVVLAQRLKTTQSAVARWEAGRTEPSLETVRQAVEAAGFELELAIVPRDPSDWSQAQTLLRLSPADRQAAIAHMIDVSNELIRSGQQS